MRFRKKPVVIEAVKVPYREWADNPLAGWDEVPTWLELAVQQEQVMPTFKSEDYWYFAIKTLEGIMLASPGDYIIQGVQGEIYPCKADIFKATYESADGES